MGVYNTYGPQQIQLKTGDHPRLHHFDIGDEVDLHDGVYIGLEGIVVVRGRRLQDTFTHAHDKWGDFLNPANLILRNNPVANALVEMAGERNLSEEMEAVANLFEGSSQMITSGELREWAVKARALEEAVSL